MSDLTRTRRVFYGWYVLAGAFVALFMSATGQALVGVMIKPMAAEFGWSRTAITSAVFLNMAFYAASVMVTGRLYDRYGPKWVIAGYALLFSAGYALMSTMDSLWQFLLCLGVLAGTGLGGITIPIFGSIVGKWFERRRGLALSLAIAGSCLGQFFLIPVFSDMIDVSGWRSACLWIAALVLGVNLVVAFGIVRGDPKKFGLKPYGSSDDVRPPSDADAGPGAAADDPARSPDPPRVVAAPRDLTLSQAMQTRSLWLFAVTMFICGSGDMLVNTHYVAMVTDYGLPTATAASMFAWLGLMSLVGILVAGPSSDRLGARAPIAVTFLLRVALFVMLVTSKGTVPFWIFALGFGLTPLVTAPLNNLLVARLYGVTHMGFIAGFINTVHMIGAGLWSFLGGVIFDQTGDYDLAFIFGAGLAAVAVVCTFFIREQRHLPPATGSTSPAA